MSYYYIIFIQLGSFSFLNSDDTRIYLFTVITLVGEVLYMIRQMKISDYDNIYSIWINTPGMGLIPIDDSREGIEKYQRRNPTTCFVAEIESQIVGAILSGHDGRRGFIYHAAVVPEHQNLGIGTSLLNAVLAALKDEGITKVGLVVFAKNDTGNTFWKNQGFAARNDLTYRDKLLLDKDNI